MININSTSTSDLKKAKANRSLGVVVCLQIFKKN